MADPPPAGDPRAGYLKARVAKALGLDGGKAEKLAKALCDPDAA